MPDTSNLNPPDCHPTTSKVLFIATANILDNFLTMYGTQGMERLVSYLVRLCLPTFLKSLTDLGWESFVKLALTVLFPVNVKEHAAVPVQLPDHPESMRTEVPIPSFPWE
ncbi:MAG: hypothetical protein H0X47_13810 [Nitrospirales bacterium]|nr:hypothetical protein [Nitrospirales bacterium]